MILPALPGSGLVLPGWPPRQRCGVGTRRSTVSRCTTGSTAGAPAPPLLLVQGAFMSTGQWGPFLPALARHRHPRIDVGTLPPQRFPASLPVAGPGVPGGLPGTGSQNQRPRRPRLRLTDDLGDITIPTLLVISDADIVTIEHAAEMLRLLGGGGWGDVLGIPSARLAVHPARATSCRSASACWTGTSGWSRSSPTSRTTPIRYHHRTSEHREGRQQG